MPRSYPIRRWLPTRFPSARKLELAGGLVTDGHGIDPMELHGAIEKLQITECCAAAGGGHRPTDYPMAEKPVPGFDLLFSAAEEAEARLCNTESRCG